MRRWMILGTAALFLMAANCQKPTEENPPGGGLSDPATAQLLASIVVDNGGYQGIMRSSPHGGGVGTVGKIGGILKATKQGEGVCDSETQIIEPSDTTDADGDGVPVSLHARIDCDTLMVGTMGDTLRILMQGEVMAQDPNDNDPWAGSLTASGLNGGRYLTVTYQVIRGGQVYAYATEGIGGTLQAFREGQSFVDSVDAGWMVDAQVPDSSGRISAEQYSFDRVGSMRFTPAVPTWTPDSSNPVSGQLEWSDRLTLQVGNQSVAVTIRTPTALQLVDDCDGDADGFGGDPVSGVLEVSDGQNTLRAEWKGCGQVEYFLNGQPFNPAL